MEADFTTESEFELGTEQALIWSLKGLSMEMGLLSLKRKLVLETWVEKSGNGLMTRVLEGEKKKEGLGIWVKSNVAGMLVIIFQSIIKQNVLLDKMFSERV